jgi:hypothetical protein
MRLREFLSRRRPAVMRISALGAITLGIWIAVPTDAQDPRVKTCGVNASTRVVATFDMGRAKDYRTRLPSAPDLPELNGEERPAFVVVVTGPVSFPAFIHENRQYTNAVCVFVGDDEPYIYADVDLRGLVN